MERKDAIEILTDMYNYYSNTDDYDSYVPFDKEDKEALEMAINSLKTDEAYQLEYELTTKNDLALIRTEGLDEEIRCTMCTNTMKSDRGCDGSCVVNKGMYKAVMDAIEKRIQPTTKNDLGVDCISRDSAIKALDYDIESFEFKSGVSKHMDDIAKLLNTIYEIQVNNIKALPSLTPQEPRKGEWLRMSDLSEQEDDRYKCSRCGNVIHHKNKMNLYTFNSWCGRCGSDNREVEE